jgi:hypothetical protein
MIIEVIVGFFVEVIFEGILLKFWRFIGNTLNRLDDFLFKKKK